MTTDGAADIEAARRLLAAEGLDVELEPAGRDGEIAAVRGPASVRERLAVLAPRIRSFGFRYVALELVDGHNEIEDS